MALNDLQQWLCYRSMGSGIERLGCGVMDKRGKGADFINYRSPYFTIIYVLRDRGEHRYMAINAIS